MQIVKYAFQQHGDNRGQLVALEEMRDIPFAIKRVYYMYDTVEGRQWSGKKDCLFRKEI
ncbi:MAG: WxcM-like protein [Anaerocolumna sp.]|nr:WxcM-like protein [Anaerocolumna sp.]